MWFNDAPYGLYAERQPGSEPWVASALGRRGHFLSSARERRGLSPGIKQSRRCTNSSLMIELQISRDNLVHQARNSFLRLDWLTGYPKAFHRKFKPSKCKKSVGPCLFNIGHFRDRKNQNPNLSPGSKVSQIRFSNAPLQSAAAALRSALVCIYSLAHRHVTRVDSLSLPLVEKPAWSI
jgi:hypothetical protein